MSAEAKKMSESFADGLKAGCVLEDYILVDIEDFDREYESYGMYLIQKAFADGSMWSSPIAISILTLFKIFKDERIDPVSEERENSVDAKYLHDSSATEGCRRYIFKTAKLVVDGWLSTYLSDGEHCWTHAIMCSLDTKKLTRDETEAVRKILKRECAEWGELTTSDWVRLLRCYPGYAIKCDWSTFNFSQVKDYHDWMTLIAANPNTAVHCEWWAKTEDGVRVKGRNWVGGEYEVAIRKAKFRADITPGGNIQCVIGCESMGAELGYVYDCEIINNGLYDGNHVVVYVEKYTSAWSAIDSYLNNSN